MGPSTYETQVYSAPPFVANQPFYEEEATIINATALQPSPQPSPPVTYQQQQLLQQMPPLPTGYANQTEYYQGNAAYASDNDEEDDTASYTSFEEEVYVVPRRDLAPPTYSRRASPSQFSRTPTFIRESPPPYSRIRDSPPPAAASIPLSARTRSAYTYAESPYERYGRSRAFDRYQERVNSRMSSYDQMPDQYGFYPNAYRI